MTILDHGLMDLEVLKPIFTAIALLEFHLTRLFHTLWIMEFFFFFYFSPASSDRATIKSHLIFYH